MTKAFEYGRVFLLLWLIQTLILKNLYLGTWFIPVVYPFALAFLPPTLNRNTGLLIGFFYGMCMDFFYSTTSLHAIASVFMMFSRPLLLEYFAPRSGYDEYTKINTSILGRGTYWTYLILMFFIHHVLLFSFEAFRLDYLLRSILRAIVSLPVSIFFVYIFKILILNRWDK